MAQSSVVLGVWDSSRYQSFKIENLDLDGKVEVLKDEACKKLNSNKITLDLVYCGLILEDDHSLSSYGVRSGVTIFVVKKPQPHVVPQSRTLSEMEVQQLVVTFRAFTASSGYRTALQRLARPEVLETIIAATPGLAEDPAAVAIIQDPELIVHMADPETVRKVAESHPSLIEAASYIAAHVHEEQANVIANQATTSTGYSYSLEALSDDEDMEMPPSSSSSSNNNRDRNPQQQHQQQQHQQQQQSSVYNNNIGQPLARNASYNAITAAQLAAAIANATNTAFNTNSAGMPRTNATAMTSSSSVSNSPSPTTMSSSANLNLIGGNSNGNNNGGQQQGQSGQANNLITSEMFSNAIQQAFAYGGNTTSGGASTLPAAANNTSSSNAPPSAQQNIFGGFATSGGGAVNQVPPEETLEGVVRRLQPQLSQMHEMGLNNDVLNVRALQATGGNVEAAIELVFSGLVD